MDIEEVKEIYTVNAIVIPKGATNGDMIKALFPEWKIEYIKNEW